MQSRALAIDGAWEFTPTIHSDPRGGFLEAFTQRSFLPAVGYEFATAQVNRSVSARGVLRGVHFAAVPPGQAKYVSCTRGAVLDVIVDIRVGSPTFGAHEAVRLDDETQRAVFLAEGLGHGFFALADDSAVTYLCSTEYAPEREFTLNPHDSDLALPWPQDIDAVLSDRDAAAPTLREAQDAGILPSYADCLARYAQLRG